MSRVRWASNRGFSIVAAVVFAAILTVTAILIQLTVPTSVPPETQGAAAGEAVTPQSQPAATPTVSGTGGIKVPCVAGEDYVVTQKQDSTSGKMSFTSQTKVVCPQTYSSAGTFKSDYGPLQKVATNGKTSPIPICKDDKVADGGPATCVYIKDPKDPNKIILDPSQWLCVYVIDDQSTLLNGNLRCNDGSKSLQKVGIVSTFGDESGAVKVQPGETILPSGCAAGQTFDPVTGALCPVATASETPEVGQATRTLDDVWEKKTDADADMSACLAKPSDCDDGELDNIQDRQIAANEELQKIANDGLKYCATVSNAGSDVACTDDEMEKLREAKTVATDGLKEGAAGPSAPGQQSAPRNPGSQQGPTGSNRSPGIFPTGGSQQGTTPFNNPAMGQNSGPASPFGGQCTSGYVCQGNTLYWQTPSNYNGSASCMTQPYQQCQFGCQPPYGAVGTTQPGQQQTTLGTIQQWLPVVTSVLSLFGGGNNNNAMMNQNISRSCATQPQQQQSPYGTGTNGQPCYQPPQQPPQSQCTSGTWQPTSSSQNGCTTGWQCVPTNGTGTGGNPTAQLSCQPKVADVGMQIGFSWSCGNSSGSAGTGFDTNGQLSGNTTAVAPAPPEGSNNTATYTLTCINQGVTASAQCQVQLGKTGIVLVTNPKQVKSGDTALIGWISAGMQSCVVSSPDQSDFTQKNAASTNVNGSVTSSPITKDTLFKLDCQTLGGQTKTATTTVTIN